MTEQILPGLYRIEIPLPDNPLRAVNSYAIRGRRSLIIDTGMNQEECMSAMLSSLSELEINLEDCDFFITHVHVDHLGLVSSLAHEDSKVYFNETESRFISTFDFIDEIVGYFRSNGFPEKELRSLNLPTDKYGPVEGLRFDVVREDDVLEYGAYTLRCIETPGHSRGHICLYDEGNRILFTGDHILPNITPNISQWNDLSNPLKDYLESLDKTSGCEGIMLPGHGLPFNGNRIQEIKEHHHSRCSEIVSILDRPMTAYEVACRMTWHLGRWEHFPSMQKMFAVSEALAHLTYLVYLGQAGKTKNNLYYVQ